MREFKGTQGEWEVVNEYENMILTNQGSYQPNAMLKTIATNEVLEANAKLIAAAPELLKALQDLYQIAHELQWENYLSGRQLIVEQAQKAINKALE